jgi:transcriptional regulator with XRE-family HTH domain
MIYICNMKDRLQQLMDRLGMTATRFADEIGVQKSGISHIMSGRNQPSYDFIMKTIKKFPKINVEWFMLGKGEMFIENTTGSSLQKEIPFVQVAEKIPSESHIDSQSRIEEEDNALYGITNVNTIKHIVIFYKNGTFELYKPLNAD